MVSSSLTYLAWVIGIIIGAPLAVLILAVCVFALGIMIWSFMAAFNDFCNWIGQMFPDPPKVYTEENGKLVEVKRPRYFAAQPDNVIQVKPPPPPLPPLQLDATEMTPPTFEFDK